MTDTYPKFKGAVVQTTPVYLNRDATIEKACGLILEAGKNGASLVVFPEVFVPGYPYWIWVDVPANHFTWQRRLYKEAVEIPSEATEELCRAAKAADAYVVIGVNEKTSTSVGTLWNTNLVIDRRGEILGKCQKLQPINAEKMVWSQGDGSDLRVFDTDIGKLGTLICGMNANTLARYALLAQGEQIHVANYPAFPAPVIDLVHQIQVRSQAHCHEGGVFTLVATAPFSQEMIDMLGDTEAKKQWFSGRPAAYSAICGPAPSIITELVDEEGIIYADIDVEDEIDAKYIIDMLVHDTRRDVVSLNLTTDEDKAVRFVTRDQAAVERGLIPAATDEFQTLLKKNLEELRQNSDLLRQLVMQTAVGKPARTKK